VGKLSYKIQKPPRKQLTKPDLLVN